MIHEEEKRLIDEFFELAMQTAQRGIWTESMQDIVDDMQTISSLQNEQGINECIQRLQLEIKKHDEK